MDEFHRNLILLFHQIQTLSLNFECQPELLLYRYYQAHYKRQFGFFLHQYPNRYDKSLLLKQQQPRDKEDNFTAIPTVPYKKTVQKF